MFFKLTNVTSFMTHIEEALIKAVEGRCECHFPRSHLLNGSFHCQCSSTQAIYRNVLIGTYNFNATHLVGFIQDWVNSGASVKMDQYSVDIDNSCPITTGSLTKPKCGQDMHCPPSNKTCAMHIGDRDTDSCFNGRSCLYN